MHAVLEEAQEKIRWCMRTNYMQCVQLSCNDIIWKSKTAGPRHFEQETYLQL